ncbi:MAG: hypothetical protein JGK24_08345 [Microcoleus sp. PH2017_29_MFU_D_A]|uniref:hypothetical protein n=1 Tax=unclassified Microcoleus TaxID=2642155 RepID=UPI001E06802F|nr:MULTISPECIES: hypothetical protein [unclassified Microcoleus]MCC3422274.1 hypothetical protein [Microcoleus sp. PH2017_07_MST_O_A]TAE14065.1 MAG: hypothetical protein EAZ94_08290 [Oscillatoriales cyanobacterium]MCC3603242.1 hypothetical protein [Microcoleus sp. PH2017_29_MFU_D_A]MCC3636570.1 hypothetical protein [Microcoleus sp. PH2017_37_MFU_D_B]TAE25677.1 MAG: hypothetical protein EAZ93_10045 [Oscillatoriales cyanobacterium]
MVTAQLSLFATSPAVGTLYKAGDWVKLRKKPSSAAAWVKRGEVFRIESVHPVDGSMRFWNPHINEWGFLYPDEVSLVPAPNDSVSEAITPVEVDTESNSPNDSVSEAIAPVEVDTESNSPNDSVSEAIAPVEVDTESNSPNDSVSGCKAISTYRPRGTARSGEYFRFSYRDGSRMRHIHIRGGNTDSPIAQARVEEVRSLLAAGAKSAEIVEMLRGGA